MDDRNPSLLYYAAESNETAHLEMKCYDLRNDDKGWNFCHQEVQYLIRMKVYDAAVNNQMINWFE